MLNAFLVYFNTMSNFVGTQSWRLDAWLLLFHFSYLQFHTFVFTQNIHIYCLYYSIPYLFTSSFIVSLYYIIILCHATYYLSYIYMLNTKLYVCMCFSFLMYTYLGQGFPMKLGSKSVVAFIIHIHLRLIHSLLIHS